MSRYRLNWKIGSGGMATVWAADRVFSSGRTQPVALKIMHEHLKPGEGLAMFHREAEINLAIAREHPGLVLTYDLLEGERGRQYIVMELVEGCSLSMLIEAHGTLPYALTRLIVERALDPLAYMHGRGVLHRDISPSNVLITTTGEVKISDFGLARLIQDGSVQTDNFRGKVAYASPESLACGELDARSDLYSFGAMLWGMLSGEPPFGKSGGYAAIVQRMNEWKTSPLPGDAPADLRKLARGWVRRHAGRRRPRSAADALARLADPTDRRADVATLAEMVTALYQRDREFCIRHSDPKESVFIDAVSVVESAAGATDTEPYLGIEPEIWGDAADPDDPEVDVETDRGPMPREHNSDRANRVRPLQPRRSRRRRLLAVAVAACALAFYGLQAYRADESPERSQRADDTELAADAEPTDREEPSEPPAVERQPDRGEFALTPAAHDATSEPERVSPEPTITNADPSARSSQTVAPSADTAPLPRRRARPRGEWQADRRADAFAAPSWHAMASISDE